MSGDAMTQDSQTSTGHWDVVCNSLSDLVRIMLCHCFDEEGHLSLASSAGAPAAQGRCVRHALITFSMTSQICLCPMIFSVDGCRRHEGDEGPEVARLG